MQLSEFLATVPDLTPEQALTAARAVTESVGRLVEATAVNGLLTDFKLISVVMACTEDPQHPAHDTCLGVYIGLLGNHPFNCITGTMAGDRAIAQLESLPAHLPQYATVINQFKDMMLWLANGVSYPFAYVTLHDVLVARGVCPTKPIGRTGKHLAFELQQDCERHSARIWGTNPRTEVASVLGSVSLDKAGKYEFLLLSHYIDFTQYCVDDAYGAI